ncbi:CD82 antigen-like [Argopecten irradians]|uniref:CD82 antigen-like n=1 Tax=Argopecten irradians TaxID=31199 RepID=UPI00371BD4D5
MSCCAGIARALLIIFNIVFWLSGGAILGVGIWFLVDKNISSYFTVVDIDTTDSYFKYAAYILIAFGAFVFLVGFCGCCGAIRGSKCLLGFYVFFLILIIGGEVAAAALMILYRMEVEKKIDTILEKSVKEKYSNSSTLRDAWGFIQIKFDCCGYSGPDDYMGNAYLMGKGLNIPRSCCVLTNKDTAMEEVKSANPKNASECNSKTANFFYNKGCKKTLLDMALQYTNILIGVGIGVACLEIFGIVFAICVCRRVDKDDSYH